MRMTYGEARSHLVTELLWSAAAQEQGRLERIGAHFDAMDRMVPRGDGADLERLNIALSFLDGWVDARNHEWLYYEGIKRDDWPVEARALAADLSADREIASPKVLHHFSRLPQRSLRERFSDFMGRRQSARRERISARSAHASAKFVYSVPIGYDGPPPQPPPPPDLSKLTHLTDLSATEWLTVSLYTFAWNVSRIIPGHFEAYARVYHPFDSGAEGPRTWRDVAASTGRTFATPEEADDLAWGNGLDHWGKELNQQARVGEAPLVVIEPLLERVRVATTAPDACYFAFWEGSGDLPVDADLSPKLHLPPDRAYHVFTGTVDAVLTNFSRTAWGYRSPNIWWPADRVWCVATEVDFAWTYVGGSRELIDAILADDRLEAVETSASADW